MGLSKFVGVFKLVGVNEACNENDVPSPLP